MSKMMKLIILTCVCVTGISNLVYAEEAAADKPGLIGAQYGSTDFERIQNIVSISGLELKLTDNDDYGSEWSARWFGSIVAPASGEVEFSGQSTGPVELKIAGMTILTMQSGSSMAGMTMEKGKEYPIELSVVKENGMQDCLLNIQWSWAGSEKVIVAGENLRYSTAKEQELAELAAQDDDDDEDDEDEEQIVISHGDFGLSRTPTKVSGLGNIDLSNATIVALDKKSRIQANAADMLSDEIMNRTRVELTVADKMPGKDVVAIVIGTGRQVSSKVGKPPAGLSVPQKADGYAIWIDKGKRDTTICLAGYDDRGALYAVGRLLRMMDMRRDTVSVHAGIKIATAPKYPLRGHQMGYRAKTNSYDAWTVKTWEQYYRDMIVFGLNAVEIVPPVTDDLPDSPVMPKKPMDMMIAQSKLADDYGLDVWIWYPIMEFDVDDDEEITPELMALAIKNRDEVLGKLARVDAVFVPSGDPDEVHPRYLFPHMKEHKKILTKYHPDAQIWSSVQNYDDEEATMGWIKAFYGWLNSGKVDWFDGVVFGPATEIDLPEMRRDVPKHLPIRRYPDITHSKSCQYEIDDWDNVWQNTLGREPINPRPRAFAKIFRDLQQYAIGFISYSEGCNDDLNKVVWSCLGWDPKMKVDDILVEYSRYFISKEYEETFAIGLLGLERNWKGRIRNNEGVYETLKLFKSMERKATPQDKLNWRFQQGLYRAYYDAYIKGRLEYEQQLEKEALAYLKTAEAVGSAKALDLAEAVLDRAEDYKNKSELRARVYELAEALWQSIRMQKSVPRYHAKAIGRGGNLDMVDIPLNHSVSLKEAFAEVRKMGSEEQKLARIARIAADKYEKKNYDWQKIFEKKFLAEGLMIDD